MDVFSLQAKISLDSGEYERALGNASDKTQSTGSKLGAVAGKIGTVAKAGFAAAGVAALGFAKSSITTGMQFDTAMSQVAATMGKTTEEVADLRDFAMDMGAKTAFSATQAAEALNYMALAGYDSTQAMEALPNVLNLAAAGSMDLAQASDMVTDAQSALGLTMDESAQLVDKMAMASSKSNTSVSQLGEAILTVGGTAKQLKGGTTELATSLGILADNGIKGAEGGTALRNIILSLSAPTDKAAKMMSELGLNVFDASGNMRSMNDIFSDLSGILGDMNDQEKTQVLSTLFNKVDLKSANALLANSGDRFNELSSAIDNAQGSAEKMANTQLDNLEGSITLLKSAFEGLQVKVSDKLTPAIRKFVDTATSAITSLNEGGLDKIVDILGNVADAALAAGSVFAAWKVGTAIQSAVTSFQGAQVALSLFKLQAGEATVAQGLLNGSLTVGEGIVALFTGQMTLAELASGAFAKAQAAVNAVMAANPIGLVIVAIAGLVAAFVLLWKHCETFRNAMTAVWEGLKEAFSIIGGFISDTLSGIGEKVADLASKFSEKWGEIKEKTSETFSHVKETASKAMDAAHSYISGKLDAIKQKYDEHGGGVKGTVAAMMEGIKQYYSVGYDAINTLTGGKLDTVVKTISGKMQSAKSAVSNVISQIKSIFADLGSKAVAWGRDMIDGFIRGIKSKIAAVGQAVSGIADKVTSYLHFSRPDVGSLREYETWMPDMIDGLTRTLRDASPKLIDEVKALSANMAMPIGGDLSVNSATSAGSGTMAGGIVQNVTINSPTQLNARESARLLRKEMTRLQMGY